MMRHEMLLLACIPAVFVALIMGFVMSIYSGDVFGWGLTCAALAAGVLPGWWVGRRFKPKDLLIAIYLGWAVSLVLVLVCMSFPDRT
jgi:peptidoglycan/LPS O-acetylase OafA/YrhL